VDVPVKGPVFGSVGRELGGGARQYYILYLCRWDPVMERGAFLRGEGPCSVRTPTAPCPMKTEGGAARLRPRGSPKGADGRYKIWIVR